MNELQVLEELAGIVFPKGSTLAQDSHDYLDQAMALDAQSATVTYSNSAIPAFLTTVVDPKIIEVLTSPMRAAEIAGSEVKKGTWVDTTWLFPVVESTGNVSSYNDYSSTGRSGANANWPERQQHYYQTVTKWGELELARTGAAKIDWAAQLNISSVLTLNKFQNLSYFYGVAGLQNYGILNDPSLSAPVQPGTKAAGNANAWFTSSGVPNATAVEVFADIQTLFYNLQTQTNGLVDLSTPMTLALSPKSQVALTFTTTFNVNVATLLQTNFPNLVVKSAPEYAGTAGNLVQLFADEIEGQRTMEVAYSEKLRAHPVILDLSSFKQKKSQGTWGAIIYRPAFIVQMLGI
jgi:hypothetical protein